MRPLTDESVLDDVWHRELAVVYKHSPACWLSLRAEREMRQFVATYPDVPVYVVDVLSHRPLSQRIAQLTGVRHESPQVIVIRAGTPAWSGSHMRVTAKRLAQETQAA